MIAGRPFTRGGATAWNIYTGDAPPDKPDGLFVQIPNDPTSVVFLQQTSSSGSWVIKATPSPTMAYHTGASVGSKCYFIAYGTLVSYDIASELWSWLNSPPTSRYNLACAAVGTKIYFAGGITTTQVNTFEVYDTISGLWSTLTPMPTARGELTGVSVGTKCYFAGGWNPSGQHLDVFQVYDTESGLWSTLATMPAARSSLAGAAVGTKCYFTGGQTSGPTIWGTLYIYDTVSGLWSTGAQMPTARHSFGGASTGTICYFAGGLTTGVTSSATNAFQAYDTVSGLWSTLASMETTRYAFPVVSSGSNLYVFGGYTSGTTINTNFYAYLAAGEPYPAGTLAIEYGFTLNLARLARDKLVDLVLAIKNVYLHDGEKLNKVTAKTNIDGEGWKNIA